MTTQQLFRLRVATMVGGPLAVFASFFFATNRPIFTVLMVLGVLMIGAGMFVAGTLGVTKFPKTTKRFIARAFALFQQMGWRVRMRSGESLPFPRHLISPEWLKSIETLKIIETDNPEFIDGTRVYIIPVHNATDNDVGYVPLAIIQTPLPGSIKSWVRLRPINSLLVGITNDIDLESISINREIEIRAKSKKTAFAVFAPDALQEYSQLSTKPTIHVEDNIFVTLIEQEIDKDMPVTMLRIHQTMLRHVMSSGALEKSPPSA